MEYRYIELQLNIYNTYQMDFSYLRKPSHLYTIKPNPQKAFTTAYGVRKRNIYYNLPYQQSEKEKIKQFKLFAQMEGVNLECSDEDICRYLHSQFFDFRNTLKKIKEFLEWEHNPSIQNISINTKQILEEGVIYTFGRDKFNRPIIVMNLGKINFQKYSLNDYYSAVNALVNVVVRYRFVKGVIQNYVWIMNLEGYNLTSLNIDKIKKIVDKLSIVYSMYLGKMLIINTGKINKMLYSGCKKFICQQTEKKIDLFDSSQLNKIQQLIDRNNLFEELGGSNKNPVIYWPPQNPREQNNCLNTDNKSFYQHFSTAQGEDSEDYYSIKENISFFQQNTIVQEIATRKACCSQNDCTIF